MTTDIHLQRDHPIVFGSTFSSLEDYLLYLGHRAAYEEAARIARGRTLLDWGCSDGYGMEMMGALGVDVSGLDSATHCIEAAHKRLPHLADRIRLYNGDVPFPARSFDAITSFQVIEHVSEYVPYLTGIAQTLKPDGCAIFTTPNRDIRLDPGMEPWNIYHVTEFDPKQLRELLLPYFHEVEIHGLQAKPEIDRLERERCERAKQKAKKDRSLLGKVQRRLGMAGETEAPTPGPPIPASLMTKYSTADFHYSAKEPEKSLCLMAIGRRPRIA